MTEIREPAKSPCGSCPYRKDVPSGVWSPEEYSKLPEYDKSTGEQPLGTFLCHQADGRVCAGWAACHDMENTLAVRLGVVMGHISEEVADALVDYETDVDIFASGTAAFMHGMARVAEPDEKAIKVIDKLERKKASR
jgi:hypothetical protein